MTRRKPGGEMRLREAAGVLGVHYQTAYGWVRDGTLPARKTGRGYQVSEAAVRALAGQRERGAEPAAAVRVRDWRSQADQLYAAITAGEEARARRSLDRLAAGVPLADLCEKVIAPALRKVGDRWAAGQLSIAEEHRASSICERLLAPHLRQPAGRPRGTAVVTTPPGERHHLPALMATGSLREDRWLVHHLAVDLPVADIWRLTAMVGAGLVVLSCCTAAAAELAISAAAEITDRTGAAVLAGRPGASLGDLVLAARRAAPGRGKDGRSGPVTQASEPIHSISEGDHADGDV